MYSKIVNPMTGRKVSITGKLGKTILNTYLNVLSGGTFGGPVAESVAAPAAPVAEPVVEPVAESVAEPVASLDDLVATETYLLAIADARGGDIITPPPSYEELVKRFQALQDDGDSPPAPFPPSPQCGPVYTHLTSEDNTSDV